MFFYNYASDFVKKIFLLKIIVPQVEEKLGG